ncbi:hypothetical protein BGX23_000199 [Mortierella sp. AD031]|nr:hypothetical protein BGX23_000199 [Mortierella sp. AD031]
MSTSMYSIKDLRAVMSRGNRTIDLLCFHVTTENSLIAFLDQPPNKSDGSGIGTYIFNGTPKTAHELRCQLYETRLSILVHSIALRDVFDIDRVTEPAKGLHNSTVLGQATKSLVDRLQAENNVYNATPDSSILNAYYVFRNKWLMHKFGKYFREFTGYLPHPGGVDPMLALLKNSRFICLDDIRDQEKPEVELITVLESLHSDADVALFEGTLQSVHQLQGRLYETRGQSYLDSLDLRYMIERLSKIDYNLAKDFKYNWLMYNIAQVFGEVAGHVPHPGGTDPDI